MDRVQHIMYELEEDKNYSFLFDTALKARAGQGSTFDVKGIMSEIIHISADRHADATKVKNEAISNMFLLTCLLKFIVRYDGKLITSIANAGEIVYNYTYYDCETNSLFIQFLEPGTDKIRIVQILFNVSSPKFNLEKPIYMDRILDIKVGRHIKTGNIYNWDTIRMEHVALDEFSSKVVDWLMEAECSPN